MTILSCMADLTMSTSLRLLLAVLICMGHCRHFERSEPFPSTLDVNPHSAKTRGSEFYLGFMNNLNLNDTTSVNKIALIITTEQETSEFTIQTKFPGVTRYGFTETAPGSGLYTKTETATKGKFTVIRLSAGHRTVVGKVREPDIAVQSPTDRNKGFRVVATDRSHELTLYALNEELQSADAYMAISCVRFPNAKDYRYFVFSSGVTRQNNHGGSSRFLITPCEQNTKISIHGSRAIYSPTDMLPDINPTGPANNVVKYGRTLDRFETLMINNQDDLTGTIIVSNKPISVFVGHQCGQVPERNSTCNFLVEQIPPHPTYGSIFFTAPFATRRSGDIFRIGSVRNGVTVDVQCSSEASTDTRVVFNDEPLTEGGFLEFHTNSGFNVAREFCCIRASNPVTVMMYVLSSTIETVVVPSEVGPAPSMVYIPPVTAYLNNYTVTTVNQFETNYAGFISYILPTHVFSNSKADQNRVLLNGTVLLPDSGYQSINCVNGKKTEVCAYGAYQRLESGEFPISYSSASRGSGAFWALMYAFARETSFAYPTAFEMEPTGLAWICGENLTVLESAGTVTIPFRRVAGDLIFRSRVFAATQDSSQGGAVAGSDYTANVAAPNGGNVRWRPSETSPKKEFTVQILRDSVAEPVEYFEVTLRCARPMNCYFPDEVYSVTIVDDYGQCADLPPISNAVITYDFEPIPMRPYGTTATYICDPGFVISGMDTRTCEKGKWLETEPMTCTNTNTISLSFDKPVYTFTENEVTGIVTVFKKGKTDKPFDFKLYGGPSTQTGVTVSASGIDETRTFKTESVTETFTFSLSDDEVSLEETETYIASLEIVGDPIGVELGNISTAEIQIIDDDLIIIGFEVSTITVTEGQDLNFLLCVTGSGLAARVITVNLKTTDGTATGLADYTQSTIPSSIEIPNGDMRKCFEVGIIDNNISEDRMETFKITITGTSPVVPVTQMTVEITIIDNDSLCPSLPDITNGMITYSPDSVPDYSVGTTATYVCEEGFTLSGNMVRNCQSDGIYNGTDPVCVMISVCQELAPLVNGMIEYRNDERPIPLRTVAKHTCNDGYFLEGPDNRTCVLESGVAMFDEMAPVCRPVCTVLPGIDNGIITYAGDDIAPFVVTTVATYTCNEGYELNTQNGDEKRTCIDAGDGSGGIFGGNEPTCDCEFINGEIIYSGGEPGTGLNVGSTATLVCDDGYSPSNEGSSEVITIILTCMDSSATGMPGEGGMFNGTLPTCQPVCTVLRDIDNGISTYADDNMAPFVITTVATYTCNEGFILNTDNGDEMRTCMDAGDGTGGAFDGIEPVCDPLCMELPGIDNGFISYDNPAPFRDGTIATYNCEDGFTLVTNPGNEMRTCRSNQIKGVITGATFDGDAPACESANMTTCIVSEPLLVQPFSRNTAYTFMGTCEHVLLQSCPPEPTDFVVSADFITDSMDNGAIGVLMISDDRFWISSEDGSLRAYEGANVIINGDSSGDHTHDYIDANVIVTVRPSESYNEIVVGGGIGVTVRHNYGDPASYSVVVSSGSSLASTCGLCGTQDGVLQLKDGSEADITDRNQVTAFTMDYLVPAANQVLRPQRRECGMIRNDTVIGNPLYTVPILNTNGGVDTLCYEVRGRGNQMYNLVSDSCVNVNAYYSPMDEPEFGNIMSQIGVHAATLQNECYNIRVTRDQCAAFVTPPGGVEVPLSAMMSKDGLSVRTYPNRVRISAPNCDEDTLVMWIICETQGGQDLLKFVISRGVNLRPSSHGLIAQFWNIPVSAVPFGVAGRDDVYSVVVPPSGDTPERNFLAEVYGRTWDKRGIQCLYAGNAQGGPYDAEVDGAPNGSIIQGRYGDYSVDDVFDTTWTFARFDEESACPVLD